jgi:hypothetical protein
VATYVAVSDSAQCGRGNTIALFLPDSADRDGHGSRSPSKASLDRELAAGGHRRGIWSRLAFGAVRLFKAIAGHAIPRLDGVTAGWTVLGGGLGTAVPAAFFAGVFPALRAFRLDPWRSERRRAERDSRNWKKAVAAGSHDATDSADVGVAGGCGVADSHHGKNCKGSVGIQHGANIADECD